MASKKPAEPSNEAVAGGLSGFSEAFRKGLAGINPNELADRIAALQLEELTGPLRRTVAAVGTAGGSSKASAEAETVQPAIAGGGKKSPRRPKRTSLDRIPGRRPMKEYPVTSEELLTLGIMQGGAALMFAFAGTCFGVYLSTRQTIDFAGKDVAQRTIGWWSGMGDAAFWLAIVTAILGAGLAVLSGLKVTRIMRNTDHG